MAEITFKGVRKHFGDVPVVRGLDLVIRDGEFFTFVGPSGCGKSTILNLIAGLEEATEGGIYFDGEPIAPLSPKDRDVAMVFQSYALYPHMTVYENIAFPLRMKKMKRDAVDEEVRRAADMLGLVSLLDRKPGELSGGQRQRVALGRAIVRKPRVFLMDEPLSNLDARLRVEMRAELKKLHLRLGITTVYVTHDQAEALGLSDRLAVLHRGVIRQCAAPSEVYAEPADTFVAGFIGSPPINLLPGTIREGGEPAVLCNGMTLCPPVKLPPPGGRVTVGIRPEDITVSSPMGEGGAEITVTLLEEAGHFTWVDFRWNGADMKGTAARDANLKADGKGRMSFSPESVHLFDADSGRRI